VVNVRKNDALAVDIELIAIGLSTKYMVVK